MARNGTPTPSNAKQLLRRYDGVEETRTPNRRSQITVIDENWARRHPGSERETVNLSPHLVFYFVSDLPLPLYLDNIGRPRGLDEQIYLTSCLSPGSAASRVTIGRGRFDDGTADVKMRNQRHRVIDNEILELKSHDRLPLRKALDCQIPICSK